MAMAVLATVVVVRAVLVKAIVMTVVVGMSANEMRADPVTGKLAGVEITAVAAAVSAFEFAVPMSWCCVDILYGMMVDAFVEVLIGAMMGPLLDLVVGMLNGETGNVSASPATAVETTAPKP